MKKFLSILTATMLSATLTFDSFAASSKFASHISWVDNGLIHYFSIGTGANNLVFLHGLFAQKSQWIYLIREMLKEDPSITKQYTIIVPDLPGYGKSTGFSLYNYNIVSNLPNSASQVITLHKFLEKIGHAHKVNMAASSMGGLIAGYYSKTYPDEVNSLAFIGSPKGAVPYIADFTSQASFTGFNPHIPTTITQYKNKLCLLIYNCLDHIPNDQVIANKFLKQNQAQYSRMRLIYKLVNSNEHTTILNHIIPTKVPIIIFWGKQDRVFGGTQSAKYFTKQLELNHSVKLILVEHAGHLVNLAAQQTLKQIAEDYIQFLKTLHS